MASSFRLSSFRPCISHVSSLVCSRPAVHHHFSNVISPSRFSRLFWSRSPSYVPQRHTDRNNHNNHFAIVISPVASLFCFLPAVLHFWANVRQTARLSLLNFAMIRQQTDEVKKQLEVIVSIIYASVRLSSAVTIVSVVFFFAFSYFAGNGKEKGEPENRL